MKGIKHIFIFCVSINIALFCYSKSFGPHHFEPRSKDEDDIRVDISSPNFHTAPGAKTDRTSIFSGTRLDLMKRSFDPYSAADTPCLEKENSKQAVGRQHQRIQECVGMRQGNVHKKLKFMRKLSKSPPHRLIGHLGWDLTSASLNPPVPRGRAELLRPGPETSLN
ncbi:hypothetical protein TNCV_2281171 [Trichonephila clavipes]|nr:hypothetical protein TNCV_2281171 [Trichonephila clavipes]